MRKCPLCEGSAGSPAFPHHTYWNNKQFNYIACAECNTVFVDPAPNDNDFALMYSKENYHDTYYDVLELDNYQRSIQFVLPLLKNKKTLIE